MMYGFGFMMQLETPPSSNGALSWTWFCWHLPRDRTAYPPPTLPWGLATVVSNYQLLWFFYGHSLAQWMDCFRNGTALRIEKGRKSCDSYSSSRFYGPFD
ncbi:hypothetical protein NC653_021297 [Populus alba x Populus x berolinensis]|uniref:Uncharacterized protein n=1 Tax=Populus alba x Populus x berolinensis TaxID=444605 RepID=A0AAD6QEK1_9ROSI|nr:hypothetical protein NC653_021297 [Populus alba x Populus x berolinensis]